VSRRPTGISDELRPYVNRGEAEGVDRIAERLSGERPLPSPDFRSALGLRLIALQSAAEIWRPRRLRLAVATYLACGVSLLAVAALGVAGTGPFAS
jgi:hypothetical protein